MKVKLFQVDAFAQEVFEGNPAAVCPLEAWLDEALMQRIAMENNLAETAFFVKKDDAYEIRWFTPTKEVNLCGHATLAAAFILFEKLGEEREKICFHSKSGPLFVTREGELIRLDFPAEPARVCETPEEIIKAFGKAPMEVLKSVDYLVVFEDFEDLRALNPDLQALSTLDLRGVCVTTRSMEYDFTSRFFAPNYGINEDSVTGSAHTQLVPYWAERLGKNTLRTKQLSPRGGKLWCELSGERVYISGKAVCYLEGEITL